MKKRARNAGFTLVEMMVALGCGVLVGTLCYYLLTAGTTLYAKGFSLNVSNLSLRYALDRMNYEISEATATPELISVSTSGTSTGVIGSSATSPAAGIRFDKYLGEHYVIVNPGGTAGVGLSAATSFQLQLSTNPLASPPVPVVNDALLLTGTTPVRAVVTGCTLVSSSSNIQTYSVTVTPAVTVPWLYPSVETAILVHEEAFVVQGTQLSFYPTMQGVTNLNNATCIPLTTNISTTGTTPFTTGTVGNYVSVGLIVSSSQYSGYLSNKQSVGQYNNFLSISTLLRPRNALEIASP